MKSPKIKPVTLVLIAVGALLAGVTATFYINSGKTKPAPVASAKPALTVATALPQQLELPVTLSANGSIAAWQEAVIGSESNGLRLLQVRVNVGDKVKTGDVLAVFSTDSTQADTAQARANLLEAQATALDAADTAARARTLDSSGALSAQQIRQYNTAEQTAKARVEAAKAMLDAQQLRGRQTQVLAPDNGVISARNATVGAVVGAGSELFRMIRGGRLEWRAEVTSAELGRLPIGTPVQLLTASGAKLTGKVRMIAPTVDPLTRIGLVYVDLPLAASAIQAGMFASGSFELNQVSALTVPQSALVVRDGFSYLFSVKPDQRISQLKVQTGRLAGERVEITSGLSPDTRVVVKGAGFLNDGDLVRVNDDSEPNQSVTPALSASAASK